jgi:hypothetical protein
MESGGEGQRRSNMNLSQMALKNSNSGSKTISGVSNIGSITIKLSSKEEELRTGSSKNRVFDDSEESMKNLRNRLMIEKMYIQEENEKSENSQVNCSDYSESGGEDDMGEKSMELDNVGKKRKGVVCSPVPEEEEDKIQEEWLSIKGKGDLGKKKEKVKKVKKVEKVKKVQKVKKVKKVKKMQKIKKIEEKRIKRKYNTVGITERLNISMTKSRSGRIRKPVKNKFEIEGPPKPKEKKIKEEDKYKTGCNCTKSNCLKSYCICYKNGVVCNSKCSCRNCVNNSSNQVLTNLYNKKEKSMNPLFYTERFQLVDAKIRKKNGRIEEESRVLFGKKLKLI